MIVEEIISEVRERIYAEVKKQYKREDLNDRFRDVLYERSERFQKFISKIRRKSDEKLFDPKKLDRFMATKGDSIVREVLDCLNNQPKMLATVYEKQVLDKLEKQLRSGLYKDNFKDAGQIEKFLEKSDSYSALRNRLRTEQDSNGFIYCDNFEDLLISDFSAIENEIDNDIMLSIYASLDGN